MSGNVSCPYDCNVGYFIHRNKCTIVDLILLKKSKVEDSPLQFVYFCPTILYDMIEKIFKGVFSMGMMSIGLIIFLLAIAVATFVESHYGTPASKIAVFNATWFEVLLLYLTINLVVNIFRYRLYRSEKMAVFAFHLSFILIIIGAGLTRYIGFEGQMPIKEGEGSNIMYSADPFFIVKANDMVNQYTLEHKHWLSEGVQNPFSHSFQLPNQQKVTLEYVSYEEGIIDSLMVADSLKGQVLEFVVRGEPVFVLQGESTLIGGMNVSFDVENAPQGVRVFYDKGDLMVQSVFEFGIIDMMSLTKEDRMKNELDSSKVQRIPTDSIVRFYNGRLYSFESESIMFREVKQNVGRVRMKAKNKEDGEDILTIRLRSKEEEVLMSIPAGVDRVISPQYISFAGINFEIAYGSKPIELPFTVVCRDFQLDRYPGSDMASSFASEVSVIDELNQQQFDQRIFMNNVMDYGGFRFFQSSYFPDESGTVLSVNYDWWGTNITYIGYLLMSVGMLLSLFAKSGRMRLLNRLISKSIANRVIKILVVVITSSGLTNSVYAHQDQEKTGNNEHHDHDHDHDHDHAAFDGSSFEKKPFQPLQPKYLSVEEALALNKLLVQDRDGRIIPFHTLSDRVVRKVHYGKSYNGMNPVQVLAAIHLYGPPAWNYQPIIYVSGKITDSLHVDKYASIFDLEDEHGQFKWIDQYTKAHEKPDARKNEFDKQIIKLGERYMVMKEVLNYRFFRVIPIPGDERGGWAWPFALELKELEDQRGNALAVRILQELYAVSEGDAKMEKVQPLLSDLMTLQWEHIALYDKINPSADLPTPAQIDTEIRYNEMDVFSKIRSSYFLFGFMLLLVFFFRLLLAKTQNADKVFKKIAYVPIIMIFATFAIHIYGLYLRSYISGYAPWSNGYEAVVFIACATILAGVIFIRKNGSVLAATAILAGMMLMVTEMNLLDPEITPMQPVLKSYWLMIHVAIITSSYGFLGLSGILGILNLMLYIFRTKGNGKRVTQNINELTSVSEMTMTIGLFMLAIGTFLGGVWANESWGRYWGWDPKETWALVSVLVYAVILHLRFIPGLNNKFLFNTVSMWGYSAIIFTFFGVNFILVGLHSYAQGDGVAEIPTWIWYIAFGFLLFNVLSYLRYRNYKRLTKKSSHELS